MLTRSARALPPDFDANQPVGRRLKLNAVQERRQIVHFNPTLSAAFPTVERPPPPPQRQLWARRASTAMDDEPKNKRRRIDMAEDDFYNELLGDNTFLDAQPGCKEAGMPLFGEGDYKLAVESKDDNKTDLGIPVLEDPNPGEFAFPLFYDEEKTILDDPTTFTFRGLSDGVKMAIMIEAFELYKDERKVLGKLQLTQEDYDDYVELYNREAESDANIAYNIQMEEEFVTMHRMAGWSDFTNSPHYPPHKKVTFRSALSLIKQKHVNAGQRYLNMVRQTLLVNKLEDYVGFAGAGTFIFKQPPKARGFGAPANHPTPESLGGSELGDNHPMYSLYEDAVRGRRFHSAIIASLIRDRLVAPVAQHQPMAPPPLPVASTATTTASAPPAAIPATLSQNLTKHNLDNVPLLAQPPKRRRLAQGRPAEMKLPLPSQSIAAEQQPDPATPMRAQGTTAAPGTADTVSTGDTYSTGEVTEFVQAMSSDKRRTVSRPDDEPEYARNITSSPLRMAQAEQRRPRVAHLERKGQDPARHISGSGSPIVRIGLKMKRQLSGVYRPERQWANEARSSFPLKATTPRLSTPRLSPPKSGSKQYFLSEQSPAHPPSSPRLFDESGKTMREKPPSPEEVHKIFKIQEQEARRQRQRSLGQSPILPPSTPLKHQAPFSAAKMSAQQPPQLPSTAQNTPIRRQPVAIQPPAATPVTYQRPFANLLMSKQPAALDVAPLAASSAARQTPILAPPRLAPANSLAPYSSHFIVDMRFSQVEDPITTSGLLYKQSGQLIPQGASFSGPSAGVPQPQQFITQSGNQQQFLQQGQHPLVQQPVSQPPQVSAPTKAPAMKQKVRRSKTTTAPKTTVTVESAIHPPAKFESGDKARGKPLKSTHKPPSQAPATERPLYVPPHARFDNPPATGSYQTPSSMPATPLQAAQQAQQDTLKRSHSMLPGMANTTIMAGPHPSTELPGGLSYYNNTFSVHPKATFQSTVQDFARDPPRQNYNNQHTKNRETNPLQAPQDFSAPRREPKCATSNGSGEQPTHPNPFRGGLPSSQAPSAGAHVQRSATESHAAQYYGPQPHQPQHQNRLQRPFQPPTKKQKVAHYPEPVGTPERPLWDRNNRNQMSPAQKVSHPQPVGTPERPLWDRKIHHQSSPAQPPPMFGGVVQQTPAQTPVSSNSSGDTTPKPNMPNGCMSGVMGVAGSETFAQAMKNHGVQIPGQLAKQAQALGKKKRNVGAKVQPSPAQQAQSQFATSQPVSPQDAVMTGPFQSGMTAAGGEPVTPKKGRGRPSGPAWSGKKKEADPKQTTMDQFLDPRLK